jgi:hypothetical protein
MIQLKKYKASSPGFVNTSEAYSKIAFWGNRNLLIPYIKVGLMPYNPITSQQQVADYSYYLLEEVQTLLFNTDPGASLMFRYTLPAQGALIVDYIGVGDYPGSIGNEMRVECKELWFYLPSTAKIEKPFPIPFRPFDIPGYKKNMEDMDIENFFLLENLPPELKELLGEDIYSLVW